MAQLLDDSSHNQAKVPQAVPRVWYLWQAVMIFALMFFVFLMIFGVLPFLPSFIEKLLYELLLPLLIFGIYGITYYTYFQGFKWGLVWSFLGATFSFFFCFVLTMTNLNTLEFYTIEFFAFFSVNKDFSSVFTVGMFYNLLVIPCTELMLGLKWVYQKWR